MNCVVHFWLNTNENKIYCWGGVTGEDGSGNAGGFQSTAGTGIDSITLMEDGRDLAAGGRLTVYKVTR